MSDLFNSCINNQFILKSTEPQSIDTFLNDGSHHYPSGLNRENGLGVITDADTMLPFSYDVKSANGVYLPDTAVQARNPTLCFEQSPFHKIEGPYNMETNLNSLVSMQTYPDGSLVSPSAYTVRQPDNQIIQTPANTALTVQNQLLIDNVNKIQSQNFLNRLYEYQRVVEQKEDEIIPNVAEGGEAPAPLDGEHQRRPEQIHNEHRVEREEDVKEEDVKEEEEDEEKEEEGEQLWMIRTQLIGRFRSLPVREMRPILRGLGVSTQGTKNQMSETFARYIYSIDTKIELIDLRHNLGF